MTNEREVTITEKAYLRLVKAEQELDRLIANGVDNWDGYSDAMGGSDEDDDEED